MKTTILKTAVVLAVTGFISGAAAATLEDVERSFYPYKDGVPNHEGLEPGMTINASNAEQFKDIIDPGLYAFVADGSVELKIGETTPVTLNENYIQATRLKTSGVIGLPARNRVELRDLGHLQDLAEEASA